MDNFHEEQRKQTIETLIHTIMYYYVLMYISYRWSVTFQGLLYFISNWQSQGDRSEFCQWKPQKVFFFAWARCGIALSGNKIIGRYNFPGCLFFHKNWLMSFDWNFGGFVNYYIIKITQFLYLNVFNLSLNPILPTRQSQPILVYTLCFMLAIKSVKEI